MTDLENISLEEVQSRILAGESFTAEEYRAIIERYRGDRKSAAATSAKSKAKKAEGEIPAFDLFAEINQAMGG